MPSYPKNYPFYNWVPKPLGILIMLLLFIPILTVGGVYSVNSTEMMSGLGIISEHIQFTNFVTSIGMAAFAPFLYRLMCIRREKMMCLVGFSLMYVFSYICAKTDSIFLLALCSLLMGFLRMVLMMVNLFTLIRYAAGMEATRNITPGLEPEDDKGWDKLDIERCVSQPGIYLFFMILGQLGTSLTAWLAFEYEWQYVYYFMMGVVLLSILIIFITMPYHKFTTRRFPINFRQFGNVVAFSVTLVCITYVLVYGKVLDWYNDRSIRTVSFVAIIFGCVFFYLEKGRNSHYMLLDVLRLRTIRLGVLLYLLLMIFNSSAMFVNVFTGIGMKLDNYQNATLGNWCMAGYAIGALSSMFLGSKGVHFKYLFAAGGAECRTIRTDEISGHYPHHRHDVSLCSDRCLCHTTDALQVPLHLDLRDAYRAHGAGSQHRRSHLLKRVTGAPTALHCPLCAKCRYAASRSLRLVYPDHARNAVSGKKQARGT